MTAAPTPGCAIAPASADVARVAAAWQALGTIPDPEVPAVSIVELGIVRDVQSRDGGLEVVLTPTYSGCPATEAIEASVRACLARVVGLPVRLVQALAPPWTTDAIAPEARGKLRAFGIAPPSLAPVDATRIGVRAVKAPAVPCPRCGSTHTEVIAPFGSTACKAQHRCRACGEPFDYFKPHR